MLMTTHHKKMVMEANCVFQYTKGGHKSERHGWLRDALELATIVWMDLGWESGMDGWMDGWNKTHGRDAVSRPGSTVQ